MRLIDNLPGERISQRLPHSTSPSLRWLSYGVWFVVVALGIALNWRLGWPPLPTTAFFAISYALSIIFSVRLPGGIYVGMENTVIAAAVMVLGPERAMIIAPVVALPLSLLMFLATYLFKRFGYSRSFIVTERLWQSGTVALAALAGGWLYRAVGGPVLPPLMSPLTYALALGLVTTFFVIRSLTLPVWLRFNRLDIRDYYRDYWWALITSGLIITIVFTPLLASGFSPTTELIWLLLIPLAAGVLLLYNINTTRLTLTDRIDDLRTLNTISQRLAANLEYESVLQAIQDEISQLMDTSALYLAIYDEDRNRIDFPILYEDGKSREPTSREFGNGLTEYIIRHRKSLLLQRNMEQEARAMGIEPLGRGPCMTFLGAPISSGDEVIGVLGLRHFGREYAYDYNDQRLLEIIASAATAALRNARLYSRSQRQAIELTALNQVSSLVSANLDLETVIKMVSSVVCEVMHGDKSAVFLLDPESKIINLAGSKGLSERYIQRSQDIPYDSPRTLAPRRGEPLILEDLENDIRIDDFRDLIEEEGILAAIEVPMRSGDHIIGSLVVYFAKPRRFDINEVELMGTLAGQVAVAVENTRLFEAINNQRRELELLYETGRLVNASLNVENVLKSVARSMLEAVGGDVFIALLKTEDDNHLRLEQSYQLTDGRLRVRQVDAKEFALDDLPYLQQVASEILPALELDKVANPKLRQVLKQHGLSDGLALPLVMQKKTVGLILIGSQEKVLRYSTDAQQLAAALADQAAVAVQNARLFEQTDVALEHRLEQLATLEMLAQRMTRRLDLQSVIELLISSAANSTGAEAGELLLLDENSQILRQAAAVGFSLANKHELWPAEKGLVGLALRTGSPVLANDVNDHPDYAAVLDDTHAELAVPVQLDNRLLGVINLESTRLDAFDTEQVSFVANLAKHAAIAIQNAQLFEAVQRRADEFQTLRAVAVDLLSSSDLKQTLRVIARQALEQTNASDIHIYLYNDKTGQITFGTSLWDDGEVDREFAPPRPDGVTGTVARSGERLVIRDPGSHPIFEKVAQTPGWSDLGSIVAMPLLKRNRVIGVFNIAYDDPSVITDDTLHFLDLLASQAAQAIDNSLLMEETRQNRNTLQAILDTINDGIMMFDMNGVLQMVNPRIGELLNVKVDSYLHKHFMTMIWDQDLDADAFTRHAFVKLARDAVDKPHATIQRRYTLDKPEFRVIEEQSIPVLGQDTDLLGRLFVLRDVTREHQIEAYRQEMSHMIVHDLRSPLAGIITGLTMAVDETGFLASSEHKETLAASLRVALTSGNQLLRLVEEILEVNKLEAGEMPLAIGSVDLKSVADRISQLLSGTASEADISIHIDAPDDLPPVRADADKIERVFINLMDNALRYTPDGGDVRIGIEQRPGSQVVTVSDTGEGIAPDERDRIFERFYQGDVKRRKRGAKGSGLGLTFCRLAVEAHGGQISVGEAAGGGAAITFTLPTEKAG